MEVWADDDENKLEKVSETDTGNISTNAIIDNPAPFFRKFLRVSLNSSDWSLLQSVPPLIQTMNTGMSFELVLRSYPNSHVNGYRHSHWSEPNRLGRTE